MAIKIQVGKTYRNNMSSGAGATRYRIEKQWAPSYFTGRAVDSTGRAIGPVYLFTSFGVPFGFEDNTLTSTFNWTLIEDKVAHEYRMIYEGTVDSGWTRVGPSLPRYVYASAQYMVREVGDNTNKTLNLLNHSEFKALQAKS
jgi:hypothetical protein